MANHKATRKDVRQSEARRERNRYYGKTTRNAIRRFKDAAATGDVATTAAELRAASKALDVAVSKGVIHANSAANKKSAMAKAANKTSAK